MNSTQKAELIEWVATRLKWSLELTNQKKSELDLRYGEGKITEFERDFYRADFINRLLELLSDKQLHRLYEEEKRSMLRIRQIAQERQLESLWVQSWETMRLESEG